MKQKIKSENLILEIFFPALNNKNPEIGEYVFTGMMIIMTIPLFPIGLVFYTIGHTTKKVKEYYEAKL